MKLSSFIKINPADSVVVCLRPMQKGEVIEVDGKSITLLQDTPAGHKVLIGVGVMLILLALLTVAAFAVWFFVFAKGD